MWELCSRACEHSHTESPEWKNTYSIAIKLKFDVCSKSYKYMLHMQYVSGACNGCSIMLLTDYASSQIFQEISNKIAYFTTESKRICLDLIVNKGYTGELEKFKHDNSELTLKVNLKALLTKKMRLLVWCYSQRE